MKTLSLSLLAFLATTTAHGFGGKKMNFTEVRGASEAQVVQTEGVPGTKVMIRGRAAELLYKMNDHKALEQKDTEALAQMKAKEKSHWAWTGKQISCSKVTDEKKKVDEYACGVVMTTDGELAALEPFSPAVFNLAQTEQKSTLFKRTKGIGRAIASLPANALDKATAYVVYEKKGAATQSSEAMVVIRGTAAQEIMWQLNAAPKADKFKKGPVDGVRGREIACVGASNSEGERCSFVVSMADGQMQTKHNPLFH